MHKDYLEGLLTSNNVVANINTNINTLLFFIPEIKYMMNFDQKHPCHNYDLWNHTLLTLYNAEELSYNDFDTRLALLLHDIGKPFCLSLKDILDIIYNVSWSYLLRWLMLF